MTDHTTTDSPGDPGESTPPDAAAGEPAAEGLCSGSVEAQHPPAEPATPAISIELHFDESANVLSGRLQESESAEPLDLEGLRRMVEEAGFSAFSFQPDALEGLLRRALQGETGEFPIATRQDAGISVGPTADRLQVLLTTTRAYGGEPVTEARLRQAMAEAGFDQEQIVTSALRKALRSESVENLVLARGIAPRSGVNSRVELLVDLACESTKPREAEAGRVDHYSVREFVIVEPGRRLMRRHPPTRGTPGKDVYGKPITAVDGKDLPLPKDMPGVLVDPDDPGLFLAEYKGHPVAIPGGIRVDKTLVMDYVDLRTGNIDFDGSVLVKGDVAAGVTIRASGDIVIKGSVERAFLHAGTDLLVALGITGSETAMQGGRREIYVEAERDVQCGFASGVRIHAGGDLLVKEYLNHCDALAMGQILVGQTGGRGVIVGGCCHGCRGVAARASGTAANVLTRIRTGMHDDLSEAQRRVFEERSALRDRLAQLREMLASMADGESAEGAGQQHLMEKIRRTVEEYEHRFAEVDQRLDALNEDVAGACDALIVCNQRVYPGTIIEIGTATLTIKTEVSGGRFFACEGEIAQE